MFCQGGGDAESERLRLCKRKIKIIWKKRTSNSSQEHKGTLECLTKIAASVLSMLLVLLG